MAWLVKLLSGLAKGPISFFVNMVIEAIFNRVMDTIRKWKEEKERNERIDRQTKQQADELKDPTNTEDEDEQAAKDILGRRE